MRKRTILGLFLILILILGIIYFIGIRNGNDNGNYPYEPNTPAPDPHNGTFVSEHGTMVFNGDGKTVVIDFDEELSELTGLPSGKEEGTYVFLSGDLPPHGSIDVRYDVAHELQISVRDVSTVVEVGLASEDGLSGTVGVDMVTEDRIPLLFKGDRFFNVIFEKK